MAFPGHSYMYSTSVVPCITTTTVPYLVNSQGDLYKANTICVQFFFHMNHSLVCLDTGKCCDTCTPSVSVPIESISKQYVHCILYIPTLTTTVTCTCCCFSSSEQLILTNYSPQFTVHVPPPTLTVPPPALTTLTVTLAPPPAHPQAPRTPPPAGAGSPTPHAAKLRISRAKRILASQEAAPFRSEVSMGAGPVAGSRAS